MAALRKLVLSLLKLDPSKPGTSMRMKQKICGWQPDYAFADGLVQASMREVAPGTRLP